MVSSHNGSQPAPSLRCSRLNDAELHGRQRDWAGFANEKIRVPPVEKCWLVGGNVRDTVGCCGVQKKVGRGGTPPAPDEPDKARGQRDDREGILDLWLPLLEWESGIGATQSMQGINPQDCNTAKAQRQKARSKKELAARRVDKVFPSVIDNTLYTNLGDVRRYIKVLFLIC